MYYRNESSEKNPHSQTIPLLTDVYRRTGRRYVPPGRILNAIISPLFVHRYTLSVIALYFYLAVRPLIFDLTPISLPTGDDQLRYHLSIVFCRHFLGSTQTLQRIGNQLPQALQRL